MIDKKPTSPESKDPTAWVMGIVMIVVILILFAWVVPRFWGSSGVSSTTDIIDTTISATGTLPVIESGAAVSTST